jgi:hypothetical protein
LDPSNPVEHATADANSDGREEAAEEEEEEKGLLVLEERRERGDGCDGGERSERGESEKKRGIEKEEIDVGVQIPAQLKSCRRIA